LLQKQKKPSKSLEIRGLHRPATGAHLDAKAVEAFLEVVGIYVKEFEN
jgi:hypothetical protein